MSEDYNKNGEFALSIITVCFNAADMLEKTISSIEKYAPPNTQYLIIDGNSTDNTKTIIKKYPDIINDFTSEADNGIYDAMNKGLVKAQGTWLLFLNAGDCLLNNKELHEFIQHSHDDIDIAYSDVVCEYPDFNKTLHAPEPDQLANHLQHANMICHNAILFRRTLHQSIPYDINYKIAADFDLLLKLLARGAKAWKFNSGISSIETGSGVSYLSQAETLKEYRHILLSGNSTFSQKFCVNFKILKCYLKHPLKKFLPTAVLNWIIKHK